MARFGYLLQNLRESFWFLPALMTLAGLGLSILTLALDREQYFAIGWLLPWAQGLGVDNARLLMSTIAGSMITVTSLVFSMTLVSLTLASGQLGPRLLALFMGDRVTQTVLGTFVSTFVFALLVLSALGERGAADLVPQASIAVALVLTLASLGLLIAFFHHLASSLHADTVVARMASELESQVRLMFAAREGEQAVEHPADVPEQAIESRDGGYVQAIDGERLVQLAREHDVRIRLLYRAGHFVCGGEPLACVSGAGKGAPGQLGDGIREAIVFGPKRTNAEDPEFALQAIVEIALRALSPGVNDPYTAITCIDRLGQALARVLAGSLPVACHADPDGVVRLVRVPLTLQGLFDAAFNEIRQAGARNVAVLVRLAETLARLARAARTAEHGDVVRRHADMLRRASENGVSEPNDLADIRERLDAIGALLAR